MRCLHSCYLSLPVTYAILSHTGDAATVSHTLGLVPCSLSLSLSLSPGDLWMTLAIGFLSPSCLSHRPSCPSAVYHTQFFYPLSIRHTWSPNCLSHRMSFSHPVHSIPAVCDTYSQAFHTRCLSVVFHAVCHPRCPVPLLSVTPGALSHAVCHILPSVVYLCCILSR